MVWNGVDLLVSPQATSSERANVTTAPSIAMLAAERRVRTLVAASTKARRGTSTMSGTAHPRVVDGSKLKRGAAERAQEASTEDEGRKSPNATTSLNESYPDRPPRLRAPPRPPSTPHSSTPPP